MLIAVVNGSNDFDPVHSSYSHLQFFEYIEDLIDYIATVTKEGLYIHQVYSAYRKDLSTFVVQYESGTRYVTMAKVFQRGELIYRVIRDPYDFAKPWNIEEVDEC